MILWRCPMCYSVLACDKEDLPLLCPSCGESNYMEQQVGEYYWTRVGKF